MNISQLQKNLGGASRERALEIAKHVFHMLCTVVPSAKQQSFAAHNPADFAIATFDDQPISLANAFEKPIDKEKNGGYLKPSVESLAGYFKKMKVMYGLGDIAAGFPVSLEDDKNKLDGIPLLKSLSEIEKWIINDGVDKKDKE